jgi:hypothetical protein
MKKITLLFCLSILSLTMQAQHKILNEITSLKMRNTGVMMDKENDVDGYYFYYEVDKLKKGKREYAIKILDNNLNEVATKSYTDDKKTILANSKFNNQALMFAMINQKEKKYKLVSFDKKGNRGKDVSINVNKKEMKWLNAMIKSSNFHMLYPVDN